MDNQAAIEYSNNPVFNGRAKHIEIHYHFVRDLIMKKQIQLKYIATEENLADCLTKCVNKSTLNKFIKFISDKDRGSVKPCVKP